MINSDVNWEQPVLYHVGDSRHSQNIQINKVIGESEKRVFYFMEKTPKDFLANPITSFVLIWEIRGLA